MVVALDFTDIQLIVGRVDDRAVDQVPHPRLVVGVQVGHLQHVAGFAHIQVVVALQNDLPLGQGPGLVGTQNVSRTEILDGVHLLDDRLVLAHFHAAPDQVGGHDDWQHFRRQAHGRSNGKNQGISPVALGKAVDNENQRRDDRGHGDQELGDVLDPSVKSGFLHFRVGNVGRHLPEHGPVASGKDYPAA